MPDILLRKATLNDCEDLFRWRNDEATRMASFTSAQLIYESHKKWFASSLENSNRIILIAENSSGNKIGNLRLDKINGKVAEISIVLDSAWRGKGLGSKLLAMVCDMQNDVLLTARVKKNNPHSANAFRRAGFFDILEYPHKEFGDILLLGRMMR